MDVASDDELAEEVELAKVQHEIKHLHQEQEAITRRQATVQRAEARRQHINRERVRLVEL
jgi:Tfp pilus assembly protein PilN